MKLKVKVKARGRKGLKDSIKKIFKEIFGSIAKTRYLCSGKISYQMRTTESYLQKLRGYLPLCAAKYGVKRMGIFGSVARREQTEDSDIDVYIEGSLHGMFAMGSIKAELEDLLGVNVDLVRIREGINPMLLNKIIKEGIYV